MKLKELVFSVNILDRLTDDFCSIAWISKHYQGIKEARIAVLVQAIFAKKNKKLSLLINRDLQNRG